MNGSNADHDNCVDDASNDMNALLGIKIVADKIRSKPHSKLFLHPVIPCAW